MTMSRENHSGSKILLGPMVEGLLVHEYFNLKNLEGTIRSKNQRCWEPVWVQEPEGALVLMIEGPLVPESFKLMALEKP